MLRGAKSGRRSMTPGAWLVVPGVRSPAVPERTDASEGTEAFEALDDSPISAISAT
jgi:hypothetical protein